MPIQDSTVAALDRRRRLRFPLSTELRYQVSGRGVPICGTGQGQNISSRGLAFRTDQPPTPGQRLSISMAWPAKLGECLLRLVFEGVVLRVRGNLTVVTIEHPEFRTAGKSVAASSQIAAMASAIDSLMVAKGVPLRVS